MPFTALSIGEAVPLGSFNGAVHSVFRHACNLALDGGRLVTLLSAHLPDQPQAVRLDTPPEFSFDEAGLRASDQAACREGTLRLAGAALRVDLRGAAIWRDQAQAHLVDLNRPEVWRAFSAVRAVTEHYQPIDGPGILGPDAFQTARAALSEAARQLDAAGAERAALPLIGLGPGATPSGDDFLVGWLCGLWSASAGEAGREAFCVETGTRIAGLGYRTTLISRSYLEQAALGRASRLLIGLIAAIADGKSDGEIEAISAAALRVGHTSGRDTVIGLLAALAVWEGMG